MDVYHKVLVKLFDVTGGRESETVDLKELVKREGYLPSYPQIKEHLSGQSWITETARVDSVKITHWGVTEAKKSKVGGGEDSQVLKREVTRTISETRELMNFLEELANDVSKENISKAEKKLNEINSAIQKLKSSV
ncbi:MAG TPA: hypothetical protein VGC97_11340 [Pyrinomonadaceae bacterium]|jgi:hypothetical protein